MSHQTNGLDRIESLQNALMSEWNALSKVEFFLSISWVGHAVFSAPRTITNVCVI